MTPQTTQKPARGRRHRMIRVGALAVAVLAIGLGWNFAWQRGAAFIDGRLAELIARSNDAGREFECTGRRIEGYPFRIGVFCDAVSLYDGNNDIRLDTGALRSAAQFYKPGQLIAEIDAPLAATLPDGTRLAADWRILRSSIRASLGGLARLSAETGELRLSDAAGGFIADVAKAELHLRPSGDSTGSGGQDNSLDLAFDAGGFALSRRGLPDLTMSRIAVDLRLDDIVEHLQPGFMPQAHLHEYGLTGLIRSAQLEPEGGGRIEVSGPFRIDPDGRMSAQATVGARDFAALTAFFGKAFPGSPETMERLEQAAMFLAAMGSAGRRSLTLTIERGVVRAGPIRIGEIEPLF